MPQVQLYSPQEQKVILPSGRSVTLLNVVVFAAGSGAKDAGNVTVQYRSSLSSDKLAERRAEAADVAKKYGGLARSKGIRRIVAQICNTPEAAAMRMLPEKIYTFELDGHDQWVVTREDSH